MAEQLWKGRFSKAVDSRVNDFNSSIRFDQRMIAQDMRGSGVHAAMLAKQGIISQEDKDAIVKGLKAIFQQIEDGNFDFSVELEDIHMNIEKRLTDAIGEAGRVVGVSGIDYISNPDIQARRDSVGDVGYEGNINYELLLSLDPDLVLLYGVNGASSMSVSPIFSNVMCAPIHF